MPIVKFDGSDTLLDLAILGNNINGENGSNVKPSKSFLNLDSSENAFRRSNVTDMKGSIGAQPQPEPIEDDIISAMTSPSQHPGTRQTSGLSTSNQSSQQFHSTFATAFSNIILRRGSEVCHTSPSIQTSSNHQKPQNNCRQHRPSKVTVDSNEDLVEKFQEVQKENEKLKVFSAQAVKCINDLTEKQIHVQQQCQKEVDDGKATCEMYQRQQDENLLTIKLLTHEKEELEKELRKLRNQTAWNKMTDRVYSTRNLSSFDIEGPQITNETRHRRSLSDESSLNSNANHLTTHNSINATGKFPETMTNNTNITTSTTATTAIASDNQSLINSISEEQHQAYNDICDKYLFDKSTGSRSQNSTFRSSAGASNPTPSVITTSRSTYRPPSSSYGAPDNKSINTIQENLFYDSDDTSSWGAKQLQRRISAMQRAQRPQHHKSDTKHSTTFHKGHNQSDEDDVNLLSTAPFNVRPNQDDESDVRTLQCYEDEHNQQTEPKPPSPVHTAPKHRNIFEQFPIIAVRNKNNSRITATDSNKTRSRPSFSSRYTGNRPAASFVNPANWLSRPAVTTGAVESNNRRNLRIGKIN